MLLAKRLILHKPDDGNNPTMIPTTMIWSWQKCLKGEAGCVIRNEQKGEKPWSAGTRRTEENRRELKSTPAARELHTKMCLGTLCTTLYTLKVAYSSVACDGWSRPGIRDLRPFVPSCSVSPLSRNLNWVCFFPQPEVKPCTCNWPMARFLVRTLGPLRKWQVISKNDHLSPKWKFPERGLWVKTRKYK